MSQAQACGVLAIIGSGETSPTMVTVHKELVARLGSTRARAVLLETPYGFQENVADVSARAQAYFARSVGLTVTVAMGAADPDQRCGGGLAELRGAGWLFAGPGSPSYALARWRNSPVPQLLRDRVAAAEGVTVFASAAAATMGSAAVPVYEIYKAGAAPHWLDGLDLLGVLGLKVAVIPHYDNAEGGTYDTRYCYLGERRLSAMERDLHADAVLGVDEHTAVIFDLRARTVEIVGRGGLTVRRHGAGTVLPGGTAVTLAMLRGLVRGGEWTGGGQPPQRPGRAATPLAARSAPAAPAALPDIMRDAERRFEAALRRRSGDGMVAAILDLECATHAWAADTDEDQGTEQARAVLRGLVARLGRAAQDGLRDPADRLGSAVEPLLTLRAALRSQRRYAAADAIRDALTAAGLEIKDTPDGTRWAARSPHGAT